MVIVERVIAANNASALARLPSGHLNANAAWLTLWAMTYDLTCTACLLNAILYARRTGTPWRWLPHNCSHWDTVYAYFARWHEEGAYRQKPLATGL